MYVCMYVLPSWTIHAGRGDYSPESESGTNKNMRGQETQAYRFNRWTFTLSLYTNGRFKTARRTRMSHLLPLTRVIVGRSPSPDRLQPWPHGRIGRGAVR